MWRNTEDDAVIHVESTTAVEPLETNALWGRAEASETSRTRCDAAGAGGEGACPGGIDGRRYGVYVAVLPQ